MSHYYKKININIYLSFSHFKSFLYASLTLKQTAQFISNIIYLNSGWTSLMYAADNGNSDLVNILLENKADINAMDNYGELQL